MCIVQVRVHCSERFSEVLVNEVEQTELMIEDIVGTALLQLFDMVFVENVRLIALQNTGMEDGDTSSMR